MKMLPNHAKSIRDELGKASDHSGRFLWGPKAGVDAIVSDRDLHAQGDLGVRLHVLCSLAIAPAEGAQTDRHATEWVLLTSGTTGVPKMLIHSLPGLTAPIKSGQNQGSEVIWGTFYDIRR